ncbi:hypothetical protein, partial [Micromonospora sp. Rc5]|uniref:hypothetical protein n=1 Tax=Micromonospora sp. Rc5 TaxID=1920666 RepID=UPI001E5EFCBA
MDEAGSCVSGFAEHGITVATVFTDSGAAADWKACTAWAYPLIDADRNGLVNGGVAGTTPLHSRGRVSFSIHSAQHRLMYFITSLLCAVRHMCIPENRKGDLPSHD